MKRGGNNRVVNMTLLYLFNTLLHFEGNIFIEKRIHYFTEETHLGLNCQQRNYRTVKAFHSTGWLPTGACYFMMTLWWFNDKNVHYHFHSYFTVEQQKEPIFILAEVLSTKPETKCRENQIVDSAASLKATNLQVVRGEFKERILLGVVSVEEATKTSISHRLA